MRRTRFGRTVRRNTAEGLLLVPVDIYPRWTLEDEIRNLSRRGVAFTKAGQDA